MGAAAAQSEKKLGAEFIRGGSYKCTPEGESAPPRTGGVTFSLGGGGCGV